MPFYSHLPFTRSVYPASPAAGPGDCPSESPGSEGRRRGGRGEVHTCVCMCHEVWVWEEMGKAGCKRVDGGMKCSRPRQTGEQLMNRGGKQCAMLVPPCVRTQVEAKCRRRFGAEVSVALFHSKKPVEVKQVPGPLD